MHDIVDLRSDTLTTPTPEMRAAMAAWQSSPQSAGSVY